LSAAKSAHTLRRLSHPREVEAALAYKSLFDFFRLSWPVLETTQPLVLNWHLEALCDHVQASLEDWIAAQEWKTAKTKATKEGKRFEAKMPEMRAQNQIFNVPPGSSKSRIVSVCAPAWMWLRWPSWKGMFLSANPRVATRDSLYCRDLVKSDWYRRAFAPSWGLRHDQDTKTLYWTTEGGSRMSGGFFAQLIGGRVDCQAVDDAHDAEQIKVDENRQKVLDRFDISIFNRVNDAETSLRWVIGQRLATLDLPGHLMQKGSWRVFILPQEFEPSRIKKEPDLAKNEIPDETFLGFRDPRTVEGELLDPVRFPPHVLESERASLKDDYAGQHQQRPSALEGGIWKRRWWGYWVPEGIDLPPVTVQLAEGSTHICAQIVLPKRRDFELQSWDMAFGAGATSSMVVGQVWGVSRLNRFLLDQVRDHLDFTDTKAAVRALSANWPLVETKLVENKANGPAILSELSGEFSGLVPVEPNGDKVTRALSEQDTLKSGFVYLPHPQLFTPEMARRLQATQPEIAAMIERELVAMKKRAKARRNGAQSDFVSEFVDEATNFPRGAYNDVVDTASQALLRIRAYIRDRDDNQIPTSRAGYGF